MAIVKNKVKEYRNGAHVRSYSEIDIPASVVKSVGEGLGVVSGAIGQSYENWAEKKQKDIEKTYKELSENINFLSKFKNLNNSFDNCVENIQNLSINSFNKFYEEDKDGNISLKFQTNIITKLMYIFVALTIISFFVFSSFDPTFIMMAITFILAVIGMGYQFLYKVPRTFKNAKNELEDLVDLAKNANLFSITNELVNVLNNTKNQEDLKERLSSAINSNFREINLKEVEEKINEDNKNNSFVSNLIKSIIISFLLTLIGSLAIDYFLLDDYMFNSQINELFTEGYIVEYVLHIYFLIPFVILTLILNVIFSKK